MTYHLTASQMAFVKSDKLNTGFVAGLGAGKSMVATFKMIKVKLANPTLTCAYYLPNYSLVQDIAFDKFPTMLLEMGLDYELNKSEKVIYVKGYGKIIFRSMDNPETIVGYEVFYSIIDECDILPMAKMTIAYNKIKARNRQKGSTPNAMDIVGTPEGYKFFYDRYVTRFDPKHDKLIRSRTQDNPYLPPDYIEELRREYPMELIEAYLEGQFTNLTSGNVYTQYDRSMNDTDKIDDKVSDIHIGVDFNVGAMSAVTFIIKDMKAYAVDEFIGLFDTPELVSVLEEKYEGRKVYIYPDAAGDARKSVQANTSDIKLLRQAGFVIVADSVNPAIMDRVNCMNSMFCNANGERRLFVNIKMCPKFSKALEQQTYDEKTKLPDKKSGHDNSGNDAAGYLIYKKFPLRYNRKRALKQDNNQRGRTSLGWQA